MNAALGTVGAMLGGLGAGISVAGIVSIAKATIDSVDALNDLRDATGASIENLSALEDVAARTGTSMDTVSAAVIKFNKALSDAKPGSEAEAAFKALGLSVQELKNLDPAEALLRAASALAGFADDANKARLTQELFGKSLKEVAPFLKDLAEQGKLVTTVTTAQAEAAEKFNKELFSLQKNAQDLARSLTGPLVEGLNSVIAKFREGSKAGKGFFEIALNNYANDVRGIYGFEKKPLNTGGVTGDFGPGAGAGRGSINPDFAKPSVGDIFGGTKDKKGSGRARAEEITDAQRALSGYVDSLSRALEKSEDLTATEKALNFLRSQGVRGEIPQVRELVLGLAEQVDKEKELAEALKLKRQLAIDAGDAITKSNEEYQALLGRLLAATPTANLEGQRKDVQLLTEEFSAGRISEELYLEAVSARLDLTGEKIRDTKSLAEDLGLSFTSAFEDAIVGGKGLQQVLAGLEQDILRIVTRKLVTEPAGDAITGFLKGASGGSAGGGIGAFLSSFLPSFAVGTDYVPNDMIAQIHKGERIVPAAQNKGGMGGNSVNVTINQTFAPGTTRATTLQAAADASRQLQYAGRNL